jgi:hypothetical protein
MDPIIILLICSQLIILWFAFNWNRTLKDQHQREKYKKWQKRLSKFKQQHPGVDTSKPKYKIKKNR